MNERPRTGMRQDAICLDQRALGVSSFISTSGVAELPGTGNAKTVVQVNRQDQRAELALLRRFAKSCYRRVIQAEIIVVRRVLGMQHRLPSLDEGH